MTKTDRECASSFPASSCVVVSSPTLFVAGGWNSCTVAHRREQGPKGCQAFNVRPADRVQQKSLRFTLLQPTGQGQTQTTIDGYQLISLPVLQVAPISELALEGLGLRSLS